MTKTVKLGELASMIWHPIADLADIYQQPIWIASPKLLCPDRNPLGIAEAYWQDTDAENGEWRATDFDMCNDEWCTITLSKEDVTHFLIPHAPTDAAATRYDTGLIAASRALLDSMSSTYTARNGREMGIQAEDGEKCWIVHSDQIVALEGAVERAALAQSEQSHDPA